MKVKATMLCDNYVMEIPMALSEHGISIFLETDCGNYLMDTGAGKAIINNSIVLDLDLRTIKGIIISHNHWDHTGGLLPVLETAKHGAKIYAHPSIFKESFAVTDGKHKYIGGPFSRNVLEDRGAVFNFSGSFREIAPGLWLTGEVPRVTEFEAGITNQVVKTEKGYEKDNVIDDQSIVIETEKGLFIILGCCHSGIINTLKYITEKMGKQKIFAIIGGMHMAYVSEEQMEKTIGALNGFDIGYIGVSHCSGLRTASRMAEAFGDRAFYCGVGTVLEA